METPVADEHWVPYGFLAQGSTTDEVNWQRIEGALSGARQAAQPELS